MRKKTSTIIGLTIATILTAYILSLSLSNQAFAQRTPGSPSTAVGGVEQFIWGNLVSLGQHAGGGHEAQLGKILEAQQGGHPGLGYCPDLHSRC
jgi:hypothetical protein